MDVKHLDAMAAGGIVDELVDWVRRESEQPLHDFRNAKIGIIVRDGHEQRHFRGGAKKLPASRVGSFGEQNERFHFRMICSNVDGLIDAATCATGGDGISRYSRLGDEVLVGGLDVGGDFIAEDHAQCLGRKFVHRRAAAVAVPAEVHGHDVEACGGEARREVVPHFALAVTLVEQQDAWTGFSGGEITAFEICAVGRLEIHDAWGRRFLCPCSVAS